MSESDAKLGVLASVVAPKDGTITDIFVNDGSEVENNQVLMTEGTTDIKAPRGGVINILIQKNDEVAKGKVLAQIK